jgi:hypothetical protein
VNAAASFRARLTSPASSRAKPDDGSARALPALAATSLAAAHGGSKSLTFRRLVLNQTADRQEFR